MGGLLRQEQDVIDEDPKNWEVVTENAPSDSQLETLLFAWKAVKHTKSNAIVVANDERTLGIGAGQPNRIDSTKIAIKHAGDSLNDKAVLASDAFFPMDDCVQYAAEHGIKAIVQGFAGMRVIDDELQFSPFVPKDWEGYNFRINFRDRLLEVTVNKEGSSIKLLKGDDLTIKLNGESLTLTTEK